jgi:hypothetical protein
MLSQYIVYPLIVSTTQTEVMIELLVIIVQWTSSPRTSLPVQGFNDEQLTRSLFVLGQD